MVSYSDCMSRLDWGCMSRSVPWSVAAGKENQ